MRKIKKSAVACFLLMFFAGSSHAGEFTDVIDAFDDDNNDPFDLNISVGYSRELKKSVITREVMNKKPKTWNYYAYQNMFDYVQIKHLLNINMEVGLFKDISLLFGLPITLSDTRELTTHKNFVESDFKVFDHYTDVNDNVDLFTYPFKSPERSGVDYFMVGFAWEILNQERDSTRPDWMMYINGRFGAGKIMQAACSNRGDKKCKNDTYLDRNGITRDVNTDGGISRGVNELVIGTRLSRRFDVIDPYFGFEVIFGWAKDGTDYKTGQNAGLINERPPIVGTLDFGLRIVPWDVPEEGRKFVINIGAGSKYTSEGRAYSPLYDALGTSDYFLHMPFVDFNNNGADDEVEGRAAAGNPWTGMSDIENYATFYGDFSLMIQPAKYIKFDLGTRFAHETEHFITKTDQCASVSADGTCDNLNYNHRPAIDLPGNRFRAEKTFLWMIFFDATAMF